MILIIYFSKNNANLIPTGSLKRYLNKYCRCKDLCCRLFIISSHMLSHLFTVLKENRPKGVTHVLFILAGFLSIVRQIKQ